MGVNRKIGLKGIWLAKLDGGNYGELQLLNAEDFQAQEHYIEAKGYSNDIIDTQLSALSHVEINMTLADLPTKLAAEISGSDTTKGGRLVGANDRASRYGLIVKQTNANGSFTARIYYNVSLTIDGVTNKSKGENLDLGNQQLKGTAIPLEDGAIYKEVDSDGEGINQTAFENIFKTFPKVDVDFKAGV